MNQKGFSLIVIFAGVFVVLIIGTYIYTSNNNSREIQPKIINLPISSPRVQGENLFEEYLDNESDISFKYPKTWEVTKDLDEYPIISVEGEGATLSLYPYGNLGAKRLTVEIEKTENLLVGKEEVNFNFYTTTITKQPALWADVSNSKILGSKFKLVNIYLDPTKKDEQLQKIKEILVSFKSLE